MLTGDINKMVYKDVSLDVSEAYILLDKLINKTEFRENHHANKCLTLVVSLVSRLKCYNYDPCQSHI